MQTEDESQSQGQSLTPGSKEAIAQGCKCSSKQPEDPETWAITFGCPLHDNLPPELREILRVSRDAQAALRGVTNDDGFTD